jgi:hypothetical protein
MLELVKVTQALAGIRVSLSPGQHGQEHSREDCDDGNNDQ